MDKLNLKAEKREIFGKFLMKARKEGKLPAVVYGPKQKNADIFVEIKDFKKIWQKAGESTIVELGLGAKPIPVLIYAVDIDPITNEPRHADFYAADLTKEITADIPLVYEGLSSAVKIGGVLVKVMHEVPVEALPGDLPHELVVDISKLINFDDKITVADLKVAKGVKILAEPDEVVVLVEQPKEEVVEEQPATLADIEVVGKKEKEEKEAAEDEMEKNAGQEKKE